MRKIPLTSGKFAVVDDCDFERISKFKWHLRSPRRNANTLYAVRDAGRGESPRFIRMHKVILYVPKGFQVDHIDGNGLNNRRSNLRACSFHQNQFNRNFSNRNTTGFKGVSTHPRTSKYRARIKVGERDIHLGLFETKIEAAKQYDSAALKFFGEFARTNQTLGKYAKA